METAALLRTHSSPGRGIVDDAVALIQPTELGWLRFWRSLRRLGVWDWPELFEPPVLIRDGASWIIAIADAGQRRFDDHDVSFVVLQDNARFSPRLRGERFRE